MMNCANLTKKQCLRALLLSSIFFQNTNAFSSTCFLKTSQTSSPSSFALSASTSSSPSASSTESSNPFSKPTGSKGRILVLGGSGFLGQAVAKRAILEGYSIVSLSRRGLPPKPDTNESGDDKILSGIEYLAGDARDKTVIQNILSQKDDDKPPISAVVHCIGLLFDDTSGLGNFNRLVSGSGSVPDQQSTYDDITRKTAFNAIEATEEYSSTIEDMMDDESTLKKPFPFIFTSAAEAGWPEVTGGSFVEKTLAPEWLRRYLVAKRAVEKRLNESKDSKMLRPVMFRPSLIYSLDRIASLPPVSAFYIGNKIGLPFVDRPVTVQSLANAVVRAIGDDSVEGVQRFKQIDALNE